jgi:hypothetical protein
VSELGVPPTSSRRRTSSVARKRRKALQFTGRPRHRSLRRSRVADCSRGAQEVQAHRTGTRTGEWKHFESSSSVRSLFRSRLPPLVLVLLECGGRYP